jgi:hypothetical protein
MFVEIWSISAWGCSGLAHGWMRLMRFKYAVQRLLPFGR